MMKRDEAIRILTRHRGDTVVVAVYRAAFDLMRVGPSDLNYYAVGAMGQASSHGLGLALGMPNRRIIVLDGDGSLLMNLGTLVTIKAANPPNLVHLVCANGCYEENGSHPLPAEKHIDLASFARAAGWQHVEVFDEHQDFDARLPEFLARPGPAFGVLNIVPGEQSEANWAYVNGAESRRAFKAAIGA